VSGLQNCAAILLMVELGVLKNRHNNFDIVRLLAALQVLQEHSAYWLNLPRPEWFIYLAGLFPGVPIFFIVSGFLVTTSYLFGAGGTVAFFARRMLRIYPALWVNVGLTILMLAATSSLSPGSLPPIRRVRISTRTLPSAQLSIRMAFIRFSHR
jgi:peptidoglycan/LPS O-acetylase OafA/YrhL